MMCDRTIELQNGRIVEQGESRAMFDDPQTAYTRELVDAVPHIETDGCDRDAASLTIVRS
jgi:peptide/nickel transport system ATP-binding protein